MLEEDRKVVTLMNALESRVTLQGPAGYTQTSRAVRDSQNHLAVAVFEKLTASVLN